MKRMHNARLTFVAGLLTLAFFSPCASAQKRGAKKSETAAPAAQPAAASTPAPAPSTGPVPVPFVGSVNINLKDGKTVSTNSLRRSGDNVMATVQIGAGAGEVGYPVATIAKIDFPEPPQLRIGTDMISQGNVAGAITQLDQIIAYYAPFKDVPGNWWSQASLIKVNALMALGRERDAEALISDLAKGSGDPEAARAARVQMAANWARKGDFEKASPVFDEVIKESKSPETLAQAWLNKGHALLAAQQFDPALMAYLRVPVFYPEQRLILPQAMLGAGRAFAGIGDGQKARETLNELISGFPASPEAAAAKTELQKLDKAEKSAG